MDLQDFESQLMYFDKPMSEEVSELIEKAAAAYSEGEAEPYLQRAFDIDPDNLSVLVALYRFYYYQHRYEDAIDIADHVMSVVAPTIKFPSHWSEIQFAHLARGVMESFTMVRFYLLAVKGAAYLNLRLGNMELGVRMLNKVIELDNKDRLGARVLLQAMGPAVVTEKQAVPASQC
ncbi:tetratricopeptide repeat protein [Aurantivibrio plasticivorans]